MYILFNGEKKMKSILFLFRHGSHPRSRADGLLTLHQVDGSGEPWFGLDKPVQDMIQPNGSGEPWFGLNKPVLDMFQVDGPGEPRFG